MFRSIAGAVIASLFALAPAVASERAMLGYGRLVSNDFIGDGEDRWRTGSWTSSRVWGPSWSGAAPRGFGELIELRLGAEVIAPDNLSTPAPGDRPYAGALSIGAHTHFSRGGIEYALGADMVLTGSGTGLGSLQRELHELLGVDVPSDATLDAQIGGGLHPTLVAEAGRSLVLSETAQMRPFVEARAGAETLLRAGVDFTFGTVLAGDLLVREGITGQRYRVIQNGGTEGFTFVVGADIAHVSRSIYLPEDRGYRLEKSRERVRAGLHWQGNSASGFYGLTWLGEEFEGQDEGQLVGSVRLNFKF